MDPTTDLPKPAAEKGQEWSFTFSAGGRSSCPSPKSQETRQKAAARGSAQRDL